MLSEYTCHWVSAAQLSKLYKVWSLWSRHFLCQYNINDWYNIFVTYTLPAKGQRDGFLGLGMFFQILSDLHMSWDKTSCSSVSRKLNKFVFPMAEVHLWTHWFWTTVYLEIWHHPYPYSHLFHKVKHFYTLYCEVILYVHVNE